MRILIADEDIASAKELRTYFPAPKKSKKVSSRGAKLVEMTVAMKDPRKRSKLKQPRGRDCSVLDLNDQPELAAVVLDAIGIALMNRGSEDGAKLIERARKIRLATVGPDHPSTAASNNSYARVLRERGDYEGARAAIGDALRVNRAVFGDRLPVAVSLNELGAIQLRQSEFAAAAKAAQDGLDIIDRARLTEIDPNTTRLLDVRGRAETAQGQLKNADATFKQALVLDERQLGTRNHPKYATHLANAALAKVAGGNRTEAKNAFSKVIDLYENQWGLTAHPNLIDAYANLGAILRMPGATDAELQKAGECLTKALALSTKIRGPKHSLVGNDHANYARWLYAVKKPKAAIASLNKALDIYGVNVKRNLLPANHWLIAEALTWKGRILVETLMQDSGAMKEAEQTLRRAIEAWCTNVYGGPLGTGIARACLGRAIYRVRKDDAAACTELCAGYAAIAASFPDKAFVKRVAGWIAEQGCDCG